MAAPTSPSVISPTLQTILTLLSSSDYYSAHQKARTSAIRLLTTRSTEVKATEALNLLWEVSRRLLEVGEVGSGSDLAGMLVETWSAKERKCDGEERAKVLQLIALIGPSGSWRKTFTDAVFAWSAKTGSGPAGDSTIHGYYGEVLFKEGSYELASRHLLLCPTADAARTLADAMHAWSKLDKDGMNAVGKYAARGTFSYLQAQAVLPARTFLSQFLSLTFASHPDVLVVRYAYPPPASPLFKTLPADHSDEIFVTKLASLNFLQLALRACQAGAGEAVEKTKGPDGQMREAKGKGRLLWMEMVGKYERQVAWLKTPEGKEATQELGTIYFGIKPPRPAGNAMMEMLGNMFSGGAAPTIGGR